MKNVAWIAGWLAWLNRPNAVQSLLAVLLAAAVVLVSCDARSAIRHVDARNAGKTDGSAAAPYRSLQAAVDAASSGDVIKVAVGTYKPIKIDEKSVKLLGGFAGGTAAHYEGGKAGDFEAANRDTNVTRIAGAGSGVVVNLNIAGDTHIEGFYISGGAQGIRSDGYPFKKQNPHIVGNVIENNKGDREASGGAVWCKTNLVLKNNIIRGNVSGRGAGISCFGSRLEIVDNEIRDNIGLGDHGGGIYAASDELIISGNWIEGNEAGYGDKNGVGGAMCIINGGTKATITNNVITKNRATGRGAGVFIDDEAEATIRHNLIYANGCGFRGGAAITVDGLDEKRRSKAVVENNTVANHPCEGPGNSIQVQNAVVIASSNIFWNNGDDFYIFENSSLRVDYSIAKESVEGSNNLTADPLFADAANGDFHLQSTHGRLSLGTWYNDKKMSPAIDAGSPKLGFDIETAPNGGRVNMGAYGNTAEASRSAVGPAPTTTSSAVPTASAPSTTPPPGPAAAPRAKGCGGCTLSSQKRPASQEQPASEERPAFWHGSGWWIIAALAMFRRRLRVRAPA